MPALELEPKQTSETKTKNGLFSAQPPQSTPYEEIVKAIEHRAKELADRSENAIHKHPFYFVLGAAAVGFLTSLIMSRRRH